REHLRFCNSCMQLFDTLAPAVAAIESLTAPEMEPHDFERLRQQILEADAARRLAESSPSLLGSARPRWSQVAVFAGGAIAIGFILGQIISSGAIWRALVSRADVAEARHGYAGNPTAAASVLADPLQPETKTVVIERVLPSGTRVIWNYE